MVPFFHYPNKFKISKFKNALRSLLESSFWILQLTRIIHHLNCNSDIRTILFQPHRTQNIDQINHTTEGEGVTWCGNDKAWVSIWEQSREDWGNWMRSCPNLRVRVSIWGESGKQQLLASIGDEKGINK